MTHPKKQKVVPNSFLLRQMYISNNFIPYNASKRILKSTLNKQNVPRFASKLKKLITSKTKQYQQLVTPM